ncbi:magnesium and cobalt transport protein [Bdellovibrio bacteriovorus]|uniref:Magnesium and cobalt transport protein n=1 Tax=Bdellovibrio bacteriovorus TaxID=959 RepID=A0A150WKP9_BDEBC|nr:CorA family divalent cation transporter [Bdellovibrio bacteriovorus]KYG64476.1 magnesium and cobalt transport protein [Bdellovibrio bacteriovorus]
MKRFEHQWQDFKWVDCEAPSQENFVQLAEEFPIPLQVLSSCLDPEHLPTAEFYEKCLMIILRHQDLQAKPKAATMQELTTKLVLFIGKDFVLSVHRSALPCTSEKKDKAAFEKHTLNSLVKNLVLQTIKSFDAPLDQLDSKTDIIEERVFALKRRNILREGYTIKRKVSSYRKVFKFTADILNKISTEVTIPLRDLNHVREPLDKLIFYADGIHEEITGLLNLHLSLMSQKTNEASYRTNEVMRVLTVFSIFFLPLNFIAGIYGMNFDNMPELHTQNGYYVILSVMLLVVTVITYWIFKKGWLKKDNL